MYAFSDAIREFGIHSVRILPAKALFRVGSLEIMHAARFLPWGGLVPEVRARYVPLRSLLSIG